MLKASLPNIQEGPLKNKWYVNGNHYHLAEISALADKLEPVIYRVVRTFSGLGLEHIGNRFEFPYKIYGKDDGFVNRVIKTYHHTVGNLGLLLNGPKGTGKTVTAKRVANGLGLPCLVVTERLDDLAVFLNEIQQDVVVFIDEFEKLWNEYQHSILTIMDGVLSNEYRKVFILTTNRPSVNENMLQRPGRLRYVNTFADLDRATIEDIVDDLLKHKAHREPLIEYISTLEMISIDIAKAVIEEVNIHNEPPAAFKDIFNTRVLEHTFDVYELIGKKNEAKPELVVRDTEVSPWPIRPSMIRKANLFVGHDNMGLIQSFAPPGTVVTKRDEEDDDGNDVTREHTYDIRRMARLHRSFWPRGYDDIGA